MRTGRGVHRGRLLRGRGVVSDAGWRQQEKPKRKSDAQVKQRGTAIAAIIQRERTEKTEKRDPSGGLPAGEVPRRMTQTMCTASPNPPCSLLPGLLLAALTPNPACPCHRLRVRHARAQPGRMGATFISVAVRTSRTFRAFPQDSTLQETGNSCVYDFKSPRTRLSLTDADRVQVPTPEDEIAWAARISRCCDSCRWWYSESGEGANSRQFRACRDTGKLAQLFALALATVGYKVELVSVKMRADDAPIWC